MGCGEQLELNIFLCLLPLQHRLEMTIEQSTWHGFKPEGVIDYVAPKEISIDQNEDQVKKRDSLDQTVACEHGT